MIRRNLIQAIAAAVAGLLGSWGCEMGTWAQIVDEGLRNYSESLRQVALLRAKAMAEQGKQDGSGRKYVECRVVEKPQLTGAVR